MIPILCSWCKHDITKTHVAGTHRLVLKAELIPESDEQWTIPCLQPRMLDRDHYFCCTRCLIEWVDDNLIRRGT